MGNKTDVRAHTHVGTDDTGESDIEGKAISDKKGLRRWTKSNKASPTVTLSLPISAELAKMIQSQPGQEISLPPTSPGTFPLTESLLGMETQISFQLKKLSSDCSKGFFPSSAAAPRRRFFSLSWAFSRMKKLLLNPNFNPHSFAKLRRQKSIKKLSIATDAFWGGGKAFVVESTLSCMQRERAEDFLEMGNWKIFSRDEIGKIKLTGLKSLYQFVHVFLDV